MILAFQGIGDTLEAVNNAALEPTAENLEAARIAMQNLSPAAQSFVRELQSMRPALDGSPRRCRLGAVSRPPARAG